MTHTEYAADTFGLRLTAPACPEPAVLPLPALGEILAVVGPSGCGKTLALRRLNAAREVVPLTRKQLGKPVLELFDGALTSASVLRALARCGLADGRLWCMKARHLSAGEQRRLELALAIAGMSPGELLVADEFDAHLDCITACVVAQNLQRIAVRIGLRLAVSTHRPETLAYLAPDRLVQIDGSQTVTLPVPQARDMADELVFTRGRLADYARFERWHYLGPGRPGPTSDVFVASHAGRAVGIVLIGYPHLLLSGRAAALPQFAPLRLKTDGAAGLNRDVRLLQRVIVDPRYRGIGVARLLIAHALGQIAAPYVECVAQMGEFSDFLQAAGFARAGEIAPPPSARALADFAARHGVDVRQLVRRRQRRALLKNLPARVADQLTQKMYAVARSRIQTGFGSLRKRGRIPESVLCRALARVSARPAYFLWTRGTP